MLDRFSQSSTDSAQAQGITVVHIEVESGDLILNRYRVLSALEQGYGIRTFSARQEALGTRVVLAISSEACGSDELVQRLHRLRHPHLAELLDLSLLDDGAPMVVYAVPGEMTLEQAASDGRVDLVALFNIAQQCCSAMAHAHRSGFFHGELASRNVYLRWPLPGRPHAVILGCFRELSESNQAMERHKDSLELVWLMLQSLTSYQDCLELRALHQDSPQLFRCRLEELLSGPNKLLATRFDLLLDDPMLNAEQLHHELVELEFGANPSGPPSGGRSRLEFSLEDSRGNRLSALEMLGAALSAPRRDQPLRISGNPMSIPFSARTPSVNPSSKPKARTPKQKPMMDRDTWTDAPAPPSVGNLPDDILIAPVFPKAPASPRLSSLRPDGPPSYRPAKLTQPGDSSSLIPALSGVPKGLPAWAMTALGVGVGAILAALTTIL